MRHVRSLFFMALAAASLIALSSSPSWADEWDQQTYFTFSAPVEIPGAALPAGTYMFKLVDTLGDRNIVRVLSQDGTKVYSTFFTVRDDRVTPADEPIVTFAETPSGSPEAIRAWFYPGDLSGHEFVYPKNQAQKIASAR